MSEPDVCLIAEGGYPFLLGGVANWTHSYISSFPDKRFHVVAIFTSAQERTLRYRLPSNVTDVSEVLIDAPGVGRAAQSRDTETIAQICRQATELIRIADPEAFRTFVTATRHAGLSAHAILNAQSGFEAAEAAHAMLLPKAGFLDFYWSWRFICNALLAIAAAPLPPARIYHAVSTGYPGLLGARAKIETGRPFIITEHGIYTNERRLDLSTADWIAPAPERGMGVGSSRPTEIHDMWNGAFATMSRIAYGFADAITTQYRDNQAFQRADGADSRKLRLIPNGIDVKPIQRPVAQPRARRPTTALIGRLVPIKDSRTYILAAETLRELVPDVLMLHIGPDDDDPDYAEQCHRLVEARGLSSTVQFLGRVPDIQEWFEKIDVLALTSISEAQPLALLEAGAAGVPAVVTNVGSCPEIVLGLPEDGVEDAGGIVVPACDPPAVGRALARLLLDSSLRDRMSVAFRRRVETYYETGRVNRLYRQLYADMERRG